MAPPPPAVPSPGDPAIEQAASIVLLRTATPPRFLLGARSMAAEFMPGRYVFPGGRLEEADHQTSPVLGLADTCRAALALSTPPGRVDALLVCALRELHEESGVRILGPASPHPPDASPASRTTPKSASVRFLCRAITPPGYTRRFDTRFFLINTDAIRTEDTLDALHPPTGELTHLHWARIDACDHLPLAFITRTIIRTVRAVLASPGTTPPVLHVVRNCLPTSCPLVMGSCK